MRADLPQRYADRVTGTGQGSSKRSGVILPHRRLHPDVRALIFAEHQRSSASLRNNRSFLKVLRYAHGALRFQKIWGHGNGLGCINVGLMSAGECRNVIPVHAQIQMEVRDETAEINDFMVDQAIRIVKGTALAYDVQYEVEKAGEMINDRELIDLVAECAHEENRASGLKCRFPNEGRQRLAFVGCSQLQQTLVLRSNLNFASS